MCGIFGLVTDPAAAFSETDWNKAMTRLFLLSESRGKEAAGVAITTPEAITVFKDSTAASRMVRSKGYREAVVSALSPVCKGGRISAPVSAIGHSRLVTNGLQGIAANNQPVWRDNAVLVHNGIVTNVDDLWAAHEDIEPRAEVDTEVIAAIVEKYRKAGAKTAAAVSRAFGEIYGESSIAINFANSNELLLATNTGSIYYVDSPSSKSLFFTSEKYICEQLLKESPFAIFAGGEIRQLAPGGVLTIDLATGARDLTTFDAALAAQAPAVNTELATNRRIDDNAEKDAERLRNLRRCSKCALPETFPYIFFDKQGVCNYCHAYEPLVVLPDEQIEAMLAKHRTPGGEPDCLVAFSGGRDSSYGLHLLVEKYKMRPLAFTYDWGMVTDLARRNQARMCGKLGVEHLWISADIKAKRANIRENVKAWLKKPDLGMIPLFMAGDKQFMWYANSTMRQTGLDLMVFSTNRLEKTDFKTGFLGIQPKDAKMRAAPATMAMLDKVNLIWQYGSRLIANPRYFNRSLPDTAWAFFSYYGINQDHLYLFDYIKWDEQEVNDVLLQEYEWERAKDTDSTWRIGDGTAPFYNHIYHTVAGFTEFDTFRSNQIREGDITREIALESIERENRPRWRSIRDYFHLINVDFDETIRIIDRIPKLYSDENLEKIRLVHERIQKGM